MNITEMHSAVRQELDKTTSLTTPDYLDEEIDFWLNRGIYKFVKTRYSGLNIKREGFEQSQKRMDDLHTLVREITISVIPINRKPNTVTAALPFRVNATTDNTVVYDYWFTLSEAVDIGYLKLGETYTSRDTGAVGNYYYFIDSLTQPTAAYGTIDNFVTDSNLFGSITGDVTGTVFYDGMVFNGNTEGADYTISVGSTANVYESPHIKRVGITECTADSFEEAYDDPFSEHILHYEKAKPLRIYYDGTVELTTDGNYGVINYHLRYLKRPERVNITETAGIVAADNGIEEGLLYLVCGAVSADYNSVTYLTGEYFYGVYDENTFVPDGVETVSLVQSDCDLPEHTHDEIVKVTVNMMLENIEQPRYQSHSLETATME